MAPRGCLAINYSSWLAINYSSLAIDPDHADLAIISVRRPRGVLLCFVALALLLSYPCNTYVVDVVECVLARSVSSHLTSTER